MAKNDLLIFQLFPGREIFMYHECSHLTTIFSIRNNTYFSDRRFLQCADFAKTLCRKIRFGVCVYLNESSEADIQPSLYNQTLSIIFQASQFFQNFMFLRISYFRIFGFRFLPSRYWPDRKLLKYEILKNLKFQKNWEA